jgi:hypothetical protein
LTKTRKKSGKMLTADFFVFGQFDQQKGNAPDINTLSI